MQYFTFSEKVNEKTLWTTAMFLIDHYTTNKIKRQQLEKVNCSKNCFQSGALWEFNQNV